MMKENIIIYIDTKTSMIEKEQSVIGIMNENIVNNIIFKFQNGFVDGIGYLEVEKPSGEKGYIQMEKGEEEYRLPIKSSLVNEEGKLYLQLRITQSSENEEIPIFKSKKFYMVVNEAINTIVEMPDEYPQWIDIANAKIMEIDQKIEEVEGKIEEVDNLDITTKDLEEGVEVTITNKQGESKTEVIKDGEKGDKGDTPMISFRLTENGDIYYATEDLIDGDEVAY